MYTDSDIACSSGLGTKLVIKLQNELISLVLVTSTCQEYSGIFLVYTFIVFADFSFFWWPLAGVGHLQLPC